MKSINIEVPYRQSMSTISEFVCRMWETEQADKYHFQFGEMGFVLPHGLLILSSQIQQFIKSRPEATFVASGDEASENVQYAAHMGFFQACGFNFGNKPGDAWGSRNYIPIERLFRNELMEEAEQRCCNIIDLIIFRSRQIATTLTQRSEEDSITDGISYSIREILRNAIEHSEAGHVDYCAQYWPLKDKVQFAVVDTGIGLKQSLSSNPHLSIANDKQAIEFSIQPGISGAAFVGAHQDPDDEHGNTGFGLYVTSQLGKQYGAFYICSGEYGKKITARVENEYCTKNTGTFVSLTLNNPRDVHFGEQIQRLIDEGEAHAELKDDKRMKKASKSSRILK